FLYSNLLEASNLLWPKDPFESDNRFLGDVLEDGRNFPSAVLVTFRTLQSFIEFGFTLLPDVVNNFLRLHQLLFVELELLLNIFRHNEPIEAADGPKTSLHWRRELPRQRMEPRQYPNPSCDQKKSKLHQNHLERSGLVPVTWRPSVVSVG